MELSSEFVTSRERRGKPRIICDCSAVIQGHDAFGKKFEEAGRVINFSRIGMYILLHREIHTGAELLIRMALPTGKLELGTSRLVVHGTVVRGEVRPGAIYGIGVMYEKYRFI